MQIIYTIYLVLICGVLPLYMKDGYYELGEAKALCYLLISAPFAAIMLFSRLYEGVSEKKKLPSNEGNAGKRITAMEFFLYATAFSLVLSLAFSVDKNVAFTGYEGWRNGFLVSAIALLIGFCFSQRRFDMKPYVLIALLAVPFFEFVLSILNRFSIYPVMLNGQDHSFLATVGNINWFAGYLSIWVPLGIGIMYLQKRFSIGFFASGIYVVTGTVALFLQGSDGGVLVLIACFGFLLWWSLSLREEFKSFLIQVFMLGLAMTITNVMLTFWGDYYNYESNLLLKICQSPYGMIIMAAAFFLYRLSRLFEEIKMPFRSLLYKRITIAVYAVLILFAGYMLVSNFNDSFGNGRGIIYRMCVDLYAGLTPWQQLVGVGQDCLYPYAMSDAMWSSSFINVFGGLALTNAHCQLLTVLIERGLLGAFLYVGLFVAILIEVNRAKEKEPKVVTLGLPIVSCFIYNQISFSQVMSESYLFILLGMAIYLGKIWDRN